MLDRPDKVTINLPLTYRKENIFIPNCPVETKSIIKGEKPFFMLEYNESSRYTLDRFLEAVKYSKIDDAMAYISKNYTDKVDIAQIWEALEEKHQLCTNYIVKSSFTKAPRNCTDSTIMLLDKQEKKVRIFNIYMLNEPDRFGKWKIYSIEQE